MTTSKREWLLAGLDACGWFAALPADAAQDIRRSVGETTTDWLRPWIGLVGVAVDSAYLLEEEPYAALLLQFARASYGAFAPARVTLTPGTDATRLTFSVDARQYELELPPEPDEIPPAFYDTVNRAMKESGSPLRFIRIHQLNWGAIPGFALALPSAYNAAVKKKLLPVSDTDDIYNDDMERVTATIEMVLRGRETYVWSVDSEPIGEVTLPGGYDQETEDFRLEGQDLRTSFQYEGGVLMLICGGRNGEPIDLGRAFTPRETRDRGDRVSQTGRRKDGTVWRTDALKGAPVHVIYAVPGPMGGRFDDVLDSFRLFDPTPAADAIFASCLARQPSRES